MKNERKNPFNKNDYGNNFIPPDGGFGWVICIAAGISNMWIFCIFQNFGLIYRDKFIKLNLSKTEITALPNTQTAIAYFIGFLTGPLLKRFTYRQVGLVGCICFAFGVFLMSFADSFIFCLFSYGFLVGAGAGLCFPSSALAINTYFKQKRRIAHSIAWTITGLGQIFMPALVTIFLNNFNDINTSQIISALCLNMIVCNLIYQPVLWHTNSESNDKSNLKPGSPLLEQYKSADAEIEEIKSDSLKISIENTTVVVVNSNINCFTKIVNYFDLNLLKSPTFINIELGMILPYLAEINFGMLTPIFLKDFGFNQEQIVLLMTLPAFSDVIGRLVLPLIFGKIKLGPRYLYLLGLIGQMIAIFMVAKIQVDNYKLILIVYLGFGLFKGLKTVYMQLILPEFVPLSRLSGAVGLNNLLTGLFALSIGPQIGVIGDRINFIWLLYFLALLILIPVISWILEFSIVFLRSRKS